jgi:hypothetical protein
VNVKATLSPDDLARACADAIWKEDDASKGLGMEILRIKPGEAVLTMTIKPHMVNGQGIAHGGFICDTAIAELRGHSRTLGGAWVPAADKRPKE